MSVLSCIDNDVITWVLQKIFALLWIEINKCWFLAISYTALLTRWCLARCPKAGRINKQLLGKVQAEFLNLIIPGVSGFLLPEFQATIFEIGHDD